ncbi:hypothetical protein [Phenylobacterium sp. 58.2.17]|uniref:hypothetical protein n=1 Tax=Phenylobacterium sp. 58.2.17 TaxID=2969306 RepID=UPI002264C53B|nr:hypothetical protein [Phenylobacterium sp. 58.2.17]MCX7587846.1 hypothetical protein [Phenylobacterium sp. 58.2.17]
MLSAPTGASAFYYEHTDLQLSQVVGLIREITNAAAAEVKGTELEDAPRRPRAHRWWAR